MKLSSWPKWAVAAGIGMLGGGISGQQALAAQTCYQAVHYYVGQGTTGYTYGVGRWISVDTVGLPTGQSNSFLINWLGVFDQSTSCYYGMLQGQCSIQAGYGVGTVGNFSSTDQGCSWTCVYMESEDYNGYTVNWPKHSMTQDIFLSVYYSGGVTVKNGTVLFEVDSYYQPNTSPWNPILIGQSWIPDPDTLYGEATTEGVNLNSTGNCPTLAEYEYYGTNGSGGNTSAYGIELYYGGSWSNWVPTSPPGWGNITVGPWPYQQLNQNYAFKSYGG